MQSTEQYRTLSTVAGADREDALAWLRRRAGWERRLRLLEAAPNRGPAPGDRQLRLVPGVATEGAARPPSTRADGNSMQSTRRAV